MNVKNTLSYIFLCIFLGWFNNSVATHIVGSELFYECINPANNTYRITLKMYRDCLAGQAPYDDVITLFVFSSETGNPVQFYQLTRPPFTPQIQPEDWDPCVAVPPAICVQEGTYTTDVVLPPRSGGYDIAWTRCCRNQAITNLLRPLAEGITFLAHVPDPGEAACNTMPSFNQVPPIFLCKDQQFAFDHSATDTDGDSLSYAITNPFTGINFNGRGTGNPNLGGNPPVVDRFENPMGPPPYRSVAFAPGFRFSDPFGSGNFNIDSETGFITVTPNQVGIYVYSISVFEWRDGVLLGENRRDFQIHVLDCLPQGDPPQFEHDFGDLTVVDDTIFVLAQQDFCFDVKVTDPNPMDQLTAYTVSAAFGNGPFFRPAATFEFGGVNPIEGQVCWSPSCFYRDQTVPLILGARDINDCPNIADVFDTVWVNISVPPNEPPEIIPDYTGIERIGDTLIITAENEFCFPFDILDPEGDSVDAFTLSPIFSDSFPPSFTINERNPLSGEVCWTPRCEREGEVIEIAFGALDRGICTVRPIVSTSIYVKIVVPQNNPPSITVNLEDNILIEDTIQVNALEEFCFTFTGRDEDPGDFLSSFVEGEIFALSSSKPEVKTSGLNPLNGEVCWEPGCEFEGALVSLIIGVRDQGVCDKVGEAKDTVYIRVNTPPNEPPTIVRDLSDNGNVSGDTVFVFADEIMNYSFTVTDPDSGDTIRLAPISDPLGIPGNPEINIEGINPLSGTISWQLSCENVGEIIPIIVGANDNGACSSMESVFDTIYVSILPPPNEPPVIVHDLTGLNFSGDTVNVSPEESFCYQVVITDVDVEDSLNVEALSPGFNPDSGATFTFNGINPVSGEVCWTPSCSFDGSIVPLIIQASDNGACNNQITVFDTVYVRINSLPSIAPDVGHDLTGNDFSGDTIFVAVEDDLCYSFYVADKTDYSSVDYTFEFQEFGGTNIDLGSAEVDLRNDSIVGEICFQADCATGGNLYRVIITGFDAGLCPPFPFTKDTVFIKVNTTFKPVLGPDLSFCAGTGGAQLNVEAEAGAAPYFYEWKCIDDPNCGLSDPFAKNPVVNPGDSTTFYVQITDNDGCTSEIDSINIYINPLPKVDAGGDTGKCLDQDGVQLSAQIVNREEIPGPYEYEWFPKEGLSDPFINDPVANPDVTTIYTVVVTAPNGCSSDNTNLDTLSTVTVGVSDRPTTNAGPDREVCAGDSIRLEGFASGGNPNYTYQWTQAEGISSLVSQTPWVNPLNTTTYYLQAFADGCPGSIDSVLVTVNPLPEVDTIPDLSLCANDTATLEAAFLDGTNIESYLWTPNQTISDPTQAIVEVSPDENTTYNLVATTDKGCQNIPYPVSVNVLPTPYIFAGEDDFLCKGDSLVLNAEITIVGNDDISPPENPSIEWYNENITVQSSNSNGAAFLIRPSRTTLYRSVATLGTCSTEDEIKIDVFNEIELNLNSDLRAICEGDSVQLFASAGRGNEQYEWFPKNDISNPLIGSPKVAPKENTVYKVVVQEGACIAEDSILIEVGPTPKVDYIASVSEGCEDLLVTFEERTDGGDVFIWDFGDGSEFSTGPRASHIFATPGRYEVILKSFGSTGCTSSTASKYVDVYPQGIASFELTSDSDLEALFPSSDLTFINTSLNGASYFWDFGDGTHSTDENPSHRYNQPGEYEVVLAVSSIGGCSDTISFGPIRIGEPELFIPNVFSPNGDNIQDFYKIKYSGNEIFSLEIFNRWGARVTEPINDPSKGWDGKMDNGNTAHEGVYFYKLQIGGKKFQGNITLLR